MEQRIKFIENKRINYKLLKYLLTDSEKSNQFTNYGPLVRRCEQEYAQKLKINTNTHEVIMVNNGTAALHVAINTLYGNKHEISHNAYNFPSITCCINKNTKSKVLDLVDNYKQHYALDVGNSYFGHYEDVISPIIDAAPSAYTFYKDHHISTFHDATAISLHHTKPLGFGEGGLLIIRKEYAPYARNLINIPNVQNYVYSITGGNFKQSELAAAGNLQFLMQLPDLDKVSNKTMEYYKIVKNELKGLDIEFLPDLSSKAIYSCLPIIFSGKKYINTDSDNIEIKKYYNPIIPFGNSINLFNKILCYPLYYTLSYNQLELIIKDIKIKYNEKSYSYGI